MAERKVNGKDILFFIDPAGGDDYSLVVCLTSNSLKRASSTIDAASKCGPDTRAGTQSVTIDIAGQVVVEPDTDRISEGDLNDIWQASTVIGWKMGPAIPVDGDVIYSGTGSIVSLNNAFDVASIGTFDANIGVIGFPVKTIYPAS